MDVFEICKAYERISEVAKTLAINELYDGDYPNDTNITTEPYYENESIIVIFSGEDRCEYTVQVSLSDIQYKLDNM